MAMDTKELIEKWSKEIEKEDNIDWKNGARFILQKMRDEELIK